MNVTWQNNMLLKEDTGKSIPPVAGVYKIMATKGQFSSGIFRLVGTDKKRILMYGHAGNLKRRVTQFLKSLRGAKTHSEGILLWLLNQHTKVKIESVFVSYYETGNGDSGKQRAGEEEESLIKEYIKKYGETPVLNSAIPNKLGKW